MRAFAAAAFAAALLLAAACSSPKQSRCERVCTREDECATEGKREDMYDVGECIDECTRLERDPQLVSGVDRHVACVEAASSCAVVLSCP